MKKTVYFLIVCLFTSCVSVKNYNENLEKPIAADKLKEDVNFAYLKLHQFHPNLYWYISKDSLDYKFDSLKTTINKPLKPLEFYLKLEPVVAKIREGHLRVTIPTRRLTKKEQKYLLTQKGLFGRYNFAIDGDQLFVLDNAEKVPNMQVGTEILKINDHPTLDYLKKYRKLITSDGKNQTFQKYYLAKSWSSFFTYENGILDSVKLETKYQNEIKTFYLKREKISKVEKKVEKVEVKKKQQQNKNSDYNVARKLYNRSLTFEKKDSSIAFMKINSFSNTRSAKFYKESFATLKKAKTKYLIIDMRNNFGGSVAEINNLYSYLTDEKLKFLNDIEVTSNKSMYHADYFNQVPNLIKPLAAIAYPFYLVGTAFSNKEKDGKHYLRANYKIRKIKEDNFKGKLYVLINGGSFSAASILPSKLKGDKRAFLVGEETGGANDGSVAGRYSTITLPNSKLKLPISLMLFQPNITFTNTEKGVVPDKEIIPTISEVLQKKDIELEWILNDIANQK
ncbi:S41 family peptidase [Halpernia frigidisoli]|uniref:C-terminal processing protease CtpA/Prc, contains a PDZ domain n=1 Tax=Halpernia frigidisoli TaxID=1125876 RepID=A0A1I3D8U5_9FLAO|nr:S41 family peptidase [Halpernia frigidisoli]SFH83164.1 C-terminal processing protease CtpA/Prc, contains a PDZ domain [Halpernia frigidisoli]